MGVFLEIDESSPRRKGPGLDKISLCRAKVCDEYSGHHKGPPPGRDAGLLRKEAAGVKLRWKRKMLFEFFGTPSLTMRKKEMLRV